MFKNILKSKPKNLDVEAKRKTRTFAGGLTLIFYTMAMNKYFFGNNQPYSRRSLRVLEAILGPDFFLILALFLGTLCLIILIDNERGWLNE